MHGQGNQGFDSLEEGRWLSVWVAVLCLREGRRVDSGLLSGPCAVGWPHRSSSVNISSGTECVKCSLL